MTDQFLLSATSMTKPRSRRFRPAIVEHLEDRAVPSSGLGHAHAQVTAAAVSSTASTYATKAARLQAQLTTVGTQVNAAYASFAISVRALEQTLTAQTLIPATMLSARTQITSLVNTLASSVQSAYGNVTHIGVGGAVIAAGLNGGSAGSLNSQMTSLFADPSGSAAATSAAELPLLFSAVEGIMSLSVQSTAIEGLLASLGGVGFVPPQAAGATPFSLTAFGTQANAAFSTFATSIRGAELTLPTDPASSAGTGTIAAATGSGSTAADRLATSVAATLTGTTAQYFVQLQQPEENAALNAFGSLLAVAAPGGTVSADQLPLVYAIGEAAINGTYATVAIQGYFIGKILA